MVPPAFHAAAVDLLTADHAATRTVLDRRVVRRWVEAFAAARTGEGDGTVSREGRYQRVFALLSLELWMRDHALSW
jgi:hypothetical protein